LGHGSVASGLSSFAVALGLGSKRLGIRASALGRGTSALGGGAIGFCLLTSQVGFRPSLIRMHTRGGFGGGPITSGLLTRGGVGTLSR